MVRGNKRILNHNGDGNALRVFQGSRVEVEYVGEFALDPQNPWYYARRPSSVTQTSAAE